MVSICILWLILFKGVILLMSCPIMFEDTILLECMSLPIRLEDISWPVWLVDIPWPMAFMEYMSLSIMLLTLRWPIMLFLDDISRPIMFMDDMSRPIMSIEVISRPIMLFLDNMSRPIKLLALYRLEFSLLFLRIMLEDMSLPIWLLPLMCMSSSFLRELESMYEVILVLMRSGSTEVSASRLIYFPVLSAVSLRM